MRRFPDDLSRVQEGHLGAAHGRWQIVRRHATIASD
jgi:hypothetical protein